MIYHRANLCYPTEEGKRAADQKPVSVLRACFDHEGNIFVAEWQEVGRVTRLRKVFEGYRLLKERYRNP